MPVMNGTDINLYGSPSVDRRPIITCAGELVVFSPIEDNITQALGQESCEFRRAQGRPPRSIHITATFTPFSPAALPKGNQWDLIRHPLFHIYWTDCNDIDLYKTNVRDDIEVWLKELQNRDIGDWLIVVVENYDGKRANKLLPRTTVLDKVKADFGTKQGDRCISVINPGKTESKSGDSWRSLVSRIRYLLAIAYGKAITLLEDYVRQQREKRNENGWNFMTYFKLQEELAQILEMLGIYEEALLQYDELDALFSQVVTTGHANSTIAWLDDFRKPLEKWHGLKLGPSLLSTKPSILELRAYLFAKQAHMLLLINKVWEVAFRCLPFLHTCVRELTLLEVSAPPGAVWCWLFLASLEVLQTCDKFNHADTVKEYSLSTACLWDYSSQKLRSLGELCGLLPGGHPTSEQLHIVVGLSAGMGDSPGSPGSPSPTDKLKEALCSQEVFAKNYLELAELAMGTYKHIGRLRSARLVGRELASFYVLQLEVQKSAAFLGDLVKTFEDDGWLELAAQTHLELAECHRLGGNVKKFVKSCVLVSAAPEIDTLLRWSYFDEICKAMSSLTEPLVLPLDRVLKVVGVQVKNDCPLLQDKDFEVELVVDSSFPREVYCSNVLVSLETENKKDDKKTEAINCRINNNQREKPESLKELKMYLHLDYKQDKQLSSASVVCKSTIIRKKDVGIQQKSTFDDCLEVTKLPLVLMPGANVIRLKKRAENIGTFQLGHFAVHIKNLQLTGPLPNHPSIQVKRQEPSLRLDSSVDCLLSGFEQQMVLTITVGSYRLEPHCILKLMPSIGLLLQHKPEEPLINYLEIEIPDAQPLTTISIPIRVLAENPSKEHQVTVSCPWSTKLVPMDLSFTSPLSASWKLNTVQQRKFVHVVVSGQCNMKMELRQPLLKTGSNCRLVDRNPTVSQEITIGSTVSYIWELLINLDAEPSSIKLEFTVRYNITEDNKPLLKEDITYRYFFSVTNYETLYILEAQVEPTKGNEFCRVGALCHLHLTIKSLKQTLEKEKATSLMYEVLAEQSLWAVCGRTAGVISFNSDCESQSVVLDVMPISSGYLPLPLVSISRYIPAETGSLEKMGKLESQPRLEPFGPGQVYNSSKGKQVHVIAAINDGFSV